MEDTYNLAHLANALIRIAEAFEEQNRANAAWIEEQKVWHEEGDPVGRRIVAIHEHEAEQAEKWREEQRRMLEENALAIAKEYAKAHEEWFERLEKDKYE